MNNEVDSIEKFLSGLLDTLDKCRHCMNCYSDCPLVESTRGFPSQGPYGILRSIYYGIQWDHLLGLEEKNRLREIVYTCTTCKSCDIRCKLSGAGIPIVDMIEDGRQLLVAEGVGPLENQRLALKSIRSEGNPYGLPAKDRLNWLSDFADKKNLSCKIVPDDGNVDVLLYTGCTASYDTGIQNVARCLVTLLEKMKINYGILKEEWCCGSPANRLGEENTFFEISDANIKRFNTSNAKSVVTISPHCYNTFINEYPKSMLNEVKIQHYTQFLSDMMDRGVLAPQNRIEKTVAYHDPCYLGKRNDIFEEPRRILRGIKGLKLVEMNRNRRDSLCCGGGGGRMWASVEETTRLAHIRLREAVEAGAEIIATACPWCHIQLADAITDTGNEGKLKVMDIAELVTEAL
jgi:Fe-S oxidoreductase